MATKFPMNAAYQAFRDCFKTAAAPQLSGKAQNTSTTPAGTITGSCSGSTATPALQRAEHEVGCIAQHQGCKQRFDGPK
jgi:hypothetical protein